MKLPCGSRKEDFAFTARIEDSGKNREAVVISPFGEELVYYLKKKVKLDFDEGNTIKKRKTWYYI